MKQSTAEHVGRYLRSAREAQQLSQGQLARKSGINQSSIVRIERGDFENPSPRTLQALAEALDLPLEELWAIAGYGGGSRLPATMPFLRAKYRDLPDDQLAALTRDVAFVLKAHGIDPDGRPDGHEDEQMDEPTDAPPRVQ